MIKLKIIAVGGLKEGYLRAACEEYTKRLSGFCKVETVELKESLLPDRPNDEQIRTALSAEGSHILAVIPPRSYSVALCVEGRQKSSEELAAMLETAAVEQGSICFVIGGSYGLAPEVKSACSERLSFSKMTFPHQLMRVILLEQTYRGFMINSGRQYHK